MLAQRSLNGLAFFRGALVVVASALLIAGCEPAPSEKVKDAIDNSNSASVTKESGSARKLLESVAKTYADAKTYEDVGEIYVEIKSDGKTQELDPQSFTLSFERPNRLRLHAFNVNVIVDGELLRATIPGVQQVLALKAPATLEAGHLLSDEILQ